MSRVCPRRRLSVGALSIVVLFLALSVPSARAAGPGYNVYVGYADNLRSGPTQTPTPWEGAPGATFSGCTPLTACSFDGGAIRVVNSSAVSKTVDYVTVNFGGCIFDIWPHGTILAPSGQLIVAQTVSGAGDGCTLGTATGPSLLDSSDFGPGGAPWAGHCNQSGVIPAVTVSVNGTATTYSDSGQVLNTNGVDAASCARPGFPAGNEQTQWVSIGSPPCPAGAALTLSPPAQSHPVEATATVNADFSACGSPLDGAVVDFVVVSGPNAGTTGTGVVDPSAIATFGYSSLLTGTDVVRASVTNLAGTITSGTVTVNWLPPVSDLEILKSMSPSVAHAGNPVTVALTAVNHGPSTARHATVVDALPAGLVLDAATPGSAVCEISGNGVRCDLGSMAPGTSRTVTLAAHVDPAVGGAFSSHDHLLSIGKVERFLGLQRGQTQTVTLSCPNSTDVMTDGSARLDSIDQGSGQPSDVFVSESRSISRSTYEFTVRNATTGQAQVHLFGVCVGANTTDTNGHHHALAVTNAVTVVGAIGAGAGQQLTARCGTGQVAISPGFAFAGGVGVIASSEPSGTDRAFVADVSTATAGATLAVSVRCLRTTTDAAQGHTHQLLLSERQATAIVPAGQTISAQVTCADNAKGIVASWNLPAGLRLLGNDPQPKTRVFKLWNPTAGPLSADLDLTCLGDRVGPAQGLGMIANSARIFSDTFDPDAGNNVASATITTT